MPNPAREILSFLRTLADVGKHLQRGFGLSARDKQRIQSITNKIKRDPTGRRVAKTMEQSIKRRERDEQREQKRQKREMLKMKPCTSSNVHSYGYDPEARILYVRFLGGTSKNRTGPGPLYEYSSVPPDVYQQMDSAASKGSFVWDALRIRGSMFGHQYDYRLARVTRGYVPRKATGFGLKPREIAQNGRVFKSKRPGTGRFSGS